MTMTTGDDTDRGTPPPQFTDPRVAKAAPPEGGELDLTRQPLLAAGVDDLDPDLDGSGAPEQADPLLAALEELAVEVKLPEVLIPNRMRPGYAVRYSIEIDLERLEAWRKRARGKRGKTDDLRLALIALANLCLGIERNGEALYDAEGEPLTFASSELRQLYGAARAGDCVRKFYGNDPYLAATLDALLAEAGVGEEVGVADPTGGSSD